MFLSGRRSSCLSSSSDRLEESSFVHIMISIIPTVVSYKRGRKTRLERYRSKDVSFGFDDFNGLVVLFLSLSSTSVRSIAHYFFSFVFLEGIVG